MEQHKIENLTKNILHITADVIKNGKYETYSFDLKPRETATVDADANSDSKILFDNAVKLQSILGIFRKKTIKYIEEYELRKNKKIKIKKVY